MIPLADTLFGLARSLEDAAERVRSMDRVAVLGPDALEALRSKLLAWHVRDQPVILNDLPAEVRAWIAGNDVEPSPPGPNPPQPQRPAPTVATTAADARTWHDCPHCDARFATAHGVKVHVGRTHKDVPRQHPVVPSTVAEPLEQGNAVVDHADGHVIPPPMARDEPGSAELARLAASANIRDDQIALRCETCDFAIPVGMLAPLRTHVRLEHNRVITEIERRPRRLP